MCAEGLCLRTILQRCRPCLMRSSTTSLRATQRGQTLPLVSRQRNLTWLIDTWVGCRCVSHAIHAQKCNGIGTDCAMSKSKTNSSFQRVSSCHVKLPPHARSLAARDKPAAALAVEMERARMLTAQRTKPWRFIVPNARRCTRDASVKWRKFTCRNGYS
jgi:hypothetical protein